MVAQWGPPLTIVESRNAPGNVLGAAPVANFRGMVVEWWCPVERSEI